MTNPQWGQVTALEAAICRGIYDKNNGLEYYGDPAGYLNYVAMAADNALVITINRTVKLTPKGEKLAKACQNITPERCTLHISEYNDAIRAANLWSF